MRYSAGDLAILNVESYEDGRKHHLAPGKTKMTVAHVENGETHDRSTRKRRKTVSPDVASKEDETRRGRGRPRLEPKHETAQDVSRPVSCLCDLSHGRCDHSILSSATMSCMLSSCLSH